MFLRRTVRYYVQESLLPPPFGLGRGDHYGPAHLDRLLQVKALQEAGRTLEEIRRTLGGSAVRRSEVAELKGSPRPESPPRELWRRVILADGVELHVAGNVRRARPAGGCRVVPRELRGPETTSKSEDTMADQPPPAHSGLLRLTRRPCPRRCGDRRRDFELLRARRRDAALRQSRNASDRSRYVFPLDEGAAAAVSKRSSTARSSSAK